VTLDLIISPRSNARYGRPPGTKPWRRQRSCSRLTLRDTDFLARLAANTSRALLPETDSAAGRRAADRLCATLEEHHFPRVNRLTASAGVARQPRDGMEALELMNAVDTALSTAKKSGRRRVSAPPRRAPIESREGGRATDP